MKSDFHFHEWAFLAQVDPQAFERRRSQLLDEFVRASGPHRPQLEALQRQIDQLRRAAANPDEAVVSICGLMCESFQVLMEEIVCLRSGLEKLELLASATALAGTGAALARERSDTAAQIV